MRMSFITLLVLALIVLSGTATYAWDGYAAAGVSAPGEAEDHSGTITNPGWSYYVLTTLTVSMIGNGEAHAEVTGTETKSYTIYSTSEPVTVHPTVQTGTGSARADVYVDLYYGGEVAGASAGFNWGGK